MRPSYDPRKWLRDTSNSAAGEMISATPAQLTCSFCGRSHPEAPRLVTGPADVAICSDCIRLCGEILAHGKGDLPAG